MDGFAQPQRQRIGRGPAPDPRARQAYEAAHRQPSAQQPAGGLQSYRARAHAVQPPAEPAPRQYRQPVPPAYPQQPYPAQPYPGQPHPHQSYTEQQPAPRRAPQEANEPRSKKQKRSRGGGRLRVVMQFVVGLFVVAAVAAAIVALYVRYYQ